jgi:phosphonate transport system ATP-binding protein
MTASARSSASFELRGATVLHGGSSANGRPSRPALRSVDLCIEPGEVVALVGPSGAGKTTLLRLIGATLRPTEGEVLAGGQLLTELSAAELRRVRTRIGFVHQDHCLVPNLRVSQNVIAGKLGQRGLLAGARSMLWSSAEDLERAYALLEAVGIPEKLFQRTDTLSGGQQQRVALARALFQDPVALLADEPVASVDPARGRDLLELILRLADERDLTVLTSLHDLSLARALYPRIVGLRDGRVEFDGPTTDVSEEAFELLYDLEGQGADG